MTKHSGIALSLWLLCACQPSPPAAEPALSLGDVLAGTPDGAFARAERPRAFDFPADHGPHPGYRSEWWYLTGNLETTEGRRFGYQWTLFRFGLSPAPPQRRSRWASNQIYMAHFTITDAKGERFAAFERLERGALSLAGADGNPLRFWIDGWQLHATASGSWMLRAQGDAESAVSLKLQPLKPVVLQGDAGLSRKSDARGNASYYYSIPRLATEGTVRLGGRTYAVQGLSWMDREWSTSALSPEQSGWDWFALQLDDGSDLMFYRLRRKDGSVDPHSAGTLIGPQGEVLRLSHDQVRIQVLAHWRSDDGVVYPSRWRLQVPSADVDLEVTPVLANQELTLSVRYWEGAVDVRGNRRGRSLTGRGYVELAGYGAAR